MPRILLILSAVFIILACVFSVQTKPQVESIKSDLKATKESLAVIKKDVGKSKDELKIAADSAATEKLRADTATSERNSIKSELTTAQAQLKEANEKAVAAAAQAEELSKKITEKESAPGVSSGALAELQGKLKEAETKLGELETVNQTLTAKNTEAEGKLAGLQKAESSRVGRIMAKGLTGQVLAVNRSYNFVVISLGDKQGVIMNGEMVVKRGGSQVAKVKITSVEPTTSIADVVPGTAGRGVAIQAGDEVIYPGTGI